MPTVDPRRLADAAEASDDGESYEVLQRGAGYRIGVGARRRPPGRPSFFVEVVVEVFREGFPGGLRGVEDRLSLARALAARGFHLRWERDGSIAGEATVASRALDRRSREACEIVGRPRPRKTP